MKRVLRERVQTVVFLGVLAVAAVWTGWLTVRQVAPVFEAPQPKPRKHEPDYIIENFSMVRVAPSGQTVTQLSAPKLVHYPDDDSADVTSPRVSSRAQDGSATIAANAASGKIFRGGEEVHLVGAVSITRTPAPPAAVFQLNTEFLQIFPDTEIMQTNVTVTGSQGAARFEAPGFVMDNGQRNTELKGPGRLVLPPRTS
jgi:lipopolysaccharide export system protein LptC